MRFFSSLIGPRRAIVFFISALLLGFTSVALAHPLGNFTINHYSRIETGAGRVKIRYVIDMAEIPTFQELQTIDTDGDKQPSSAELDAYLERVATQLTEGLRLDIDGTRVNLEIVSKNISMPAGAGGLSTLRIECDLASAAITGDPTATHRLRFEDTNYGDRIGWREMVANSSDGVTIFDSSVYGNAVTDELKAYPQDMIAAPLDERVAEFSFTRGAVPSGAAQLLTRDGHAATQSRDRFAELIAVPKLTPTVALLGLLFAAVLGSIHAMSPGHGKTVVGAYLVGTRGTARHAAFLGLTVTITHTLGVFALGLVTLFASQYIVPEQLFPVLSLISGGIVLVIGLSLFVRRLRAVLQPAEHDHTHDHAHEHADHAPAHSHSLSHIHSHHEHAHDHDHAHSHHTHTHTHTHDHEDHDHTHSHHDHSHHTSGITHHDDDHHHHDHTSHSPLTHSHGGREHTHLPPGSDGSPITLRSLLALGISGGLLPCPSALVVMLSAISLHRVGYGLILVIAFSLGLAATLTAVGLLFVYARRFISRPMAQSRLVRVLPVLSALVIAVAGAVICYEALIQAGVKFALL